MTFGEKLAIMRTQCGYSQEYLAEHLGVSRQAISKWEQGTALPDTDKVVTISDFFGVSTDYLLKDNMELNHNESMDRVVLRFLSSAQDMDGISKELVRIMKDGIIDEMEKGRMNEIVEILNSIELIIDEIRRKVNMK